MNPSMKEQLKQWKRDHQEVKRERKRKVPPQKKQEKLSERDLKELMGIGRDRFKRHRGAMRRK